MQSHKKSPLVAHIKNSITLICSVANYINIGVFLWFSDIITYSYILIATLIIIN